MPELDNKKERNTMFTQSDLDGCTGSTKLYFNRLFRKCEYTEGIKLIGDNGATWLQTDVLAVLCHKLADQHFVCIKATKEESGAKVVYDDGNGNVLHKQEYEFSDLPCDVKMFCVNNRLILASEY